MLASVALRAAEARAAERVAFAERAEAIVAAVRAGARLDEIAEAAGLTKAAASAIARRTLDTRSARGGPYRRRRGTSAALERVADRARQTEEASREARRAILERDRAILAGADARVPVPTMAEAMNMRPPAVYTLIRRRRREATQQPSGTLAS